MNGFEDLPTDEDGLAAVAARPPSLEVQNEALRRLRPAIEERARGIAFNQFQVSKQRRQDLVDEAFSHIGKQIVHYDPSRGVKFTTWCWLVLFNRFLDLIRHWNGDLVTKPGTKNIALCEPVSPGEARSRLED